MTEQEKHIRAVTRECRGPFLLSREDRTSLTHAWQDVEAKADFVAGIQLKDFIENAVGAPHAVISPNDWESMLRRVASLINAHTESCGYDFNQTVLATPFDGEEHEYKCPKCGVEGTFRTPWFEEQ